MAEKAKSSKKWIYLVLALAVIAVAVVLIVVFTGKNGEAKAIMEMSTNPSVQVVLDKNDKVIAEVAVNADGEKLLANVSFVGMTAEEAGQAFAEIATLMEKIDVNSLTGVEVNISISGDAENLQDFEKLADNVKKSVNEYFQENGIMARAVMDINADVEACLAKIGADSKEWATKTTAELLNFAKDKANELNSVALSARDELESKIDTLYSDSTLLNLENAFELAEVALSEAEEFLDKTMQQLGSLMTNEQKKELEAAVNEAKKDLEKAKNEYVKHKNTIDAKFRTFLDEVRDEGKAAFEQLKASAKEAYEASKARVETAFEEFANMSETEKQAVINDIISWQNQAA